MSVNTVLSQPEMLCQSCFNLHMVLYTGPIDILCFNSTWRCHDRNWKLAILLA